MPTDGSFNIRSSITTKLLIVVFSIYLLVTVTVTAMQMFIEYRHEQNRVAKELYHFENILKPSLAQAVWGYNEGQINSIIEGLTYSHIIFGVEVIARGANQQIWQAGEIKSSYELPPYLQDHFLPSIFLRLFSKPIVYHFPLSHVEQYTGVNEHIGDVILYSNTFAILDAVKIAFLVILVNALIKTVTLWLFFLWAGYKYLSAPLIKLTNAIKRVSAGELVYVPTTGKGKAGTEIDVLGYAFNSMLLKVNKAQASLSQTKQHLANIIDAMPSALIGVTYSGYITEWNLQAISLSGLSKDEAINMHYTQTLPVLKQHAAQIDTALNQHEPDHIRHVAIDTQDRTQYYDIVIYPVTDIQTRVVIRLDDVSKQYQLQEMMVQTEKMTSVGRLAAGMAHEINNPLGAIIQSTQNIERRLAHDNENNQVYASTHGIDLTALHTFLDERRIFRFLSGIRESGERAAKIVANLLCFSRRSNTRLVPTALQDPVEKAIELMQTEYNMTNQLDFKQIKLERDYQDAASEVLCEPTEIQQVVMNLLKNAAQAMSDAQIAIEAQQITVRIRRETQGMTLEVQDNGPGMSEKVRRRIFEPFFTTKEVGSGTGLGLSVSYHIITEFHQGTMGVKSIPGAGTTFSILLPFSS